MHLDSLPSDTRNLLAELAQHIPEISHYLLVGGTALALNIAHRTSEDLDFAWPGKKLDRDQVDRIIKALEARGHVPVYNNLQEDIDDAIEHGLELDDYCQNWLVDNVKLTFFAFGDYDVDRELIRKGLETPATIGFVNVADTKTIFDAKCIALTDRIKSRDIFDLCWLIHKVPHPRAIAEVFERAQHYRKNLPYDHIRHRLLDWKIPITDESFEALVQEPISIAGNRRVIGDRPRLLLSNKRSR